MILVEPEELEKLTFKSFIELQRLPMGEAYAHELIYWAVLTLLGQPPEYIKGRDETRLKFLESCNSAIIFFEASEAYEKCGILKMYCDICEQ